MNSSGREVPKHTHLNAHFILVVRGVYLTAALAEEGPCGPSTLVFNPSGTTHRDRFRTSEGRFFAISVAPEIAAEIEREIHSPVAFTTGKITKTIQTMYSEFQDHSDFSQMIMEGLGLELVGRAGLWPGIRDTKAPYWLRRAGESLQDLCMESISIKEIARDSDVHPIHLARAFRRYFGCSPGDYRRQCRMERVKQLLVHGTTPLAELALQVGFKDQSQFTSAFKRFTGMTPGAFRRTFRR